MDDSTLTKEALAGLLREAEQAHGQFERQLGHRDADWPDWYAAFIVSKLQERRQPSGSREATEEQPS
jgi:hypothetical protein